MNTQGQMFGGNWTDQKLECVRKYLRAYTTIMVKQPFRFAYNVFEQVADNPLLHYNSKNVPLYLLCFAAGNPKGAPTAVKIAQHILNGMRTGPQLTLEI